MFIKVYNVLSISRPNSFCVLFDIVSVKPSLPPSLVFENFISNFTSFYLKKFLDVLRY